MENTVCCTCRGPKANYLCGLCGDTVCKACTQFLDDHALTYLAKIPPVLGHAYYCGSCHTEKVAPELEKFEATMEKARQVAIFFKDEGKLTRLIRRKEKPFQVKGCADKQEVIMKLAFLAAEANFNALVDVNVELLKTRDNSYLLTHCQGSAVPVNVNQSQLNRT